MTLDQLLSKAFNGKAENIVISKNIIMFHLDGVETRINLVSFIDQIYNDHEAQLKAKDEEIDMLKACLSSIVNLYVKNQGTEHEFITCITPKSAWEMTKKQRKECRIWSVFDTARQILKGTTMTTKEAIQAMLDGNKVRRIHWGIDVFLYFDSPYFVNQDRSIRDTFKDSNDWTFYEEPKQKQVVVIEKWLCETDGRYEVRESSNIKAYVNGYWKTVKLLDTYEVEL